MFADNLTNRGFFVVSGASDPLYPASEVVPWIEALHAAMLYGAELKLDLHRYAEGPTRHPGVGRE